MLRCNGKYGLEVHHKRRDGGNDLENAEVLCTRCHEATSTFGTPGKKPPPFSEATRQAALKRAGHRCECTRTGGCH